ncbi:MAG: cell division protein ZapE, partial [Burkholderiales bacterium]
TEHRETGLIGLLAKKKAVPGIYLWGGVGRGKSFLMDSFFGFVEISAKQRVHFHRFMQEIHRQLHALKGHADPLIAVAKHIAGETHLLCLDEMHVSDIADAMIMRRLLEGLCERGVVLVTTSNQKPDDLYQGGLQRAQFMPAIDLLKQNLESVNLDAGVDYRLRALEQAGVYHSPLNTAAEESLAQAFFHIARHEGEADCQLEIEERALTAIRHAPGVAWFDYLELCDRPRSQADYIELARRYHTVLLSGVPRLGVEQIDQVRRLTWLIDEFYDRRVKLIVAAAAGPEKLFSGAASEFQRTVSRLIEMQSRAYLSQPHLS